MDRNRETERKAGRTIAIGSSIFSIVFMIVWCSIAASAGAWFMLLFGVPMLGFTVYRLVLICRQTGSRPKDPWEQADRSRGYTTYTEPHQQQGDGYCPYCGTSVAGSFTYCPSCGRKLR